MRKPKRIRLSGKANTKQVPTTAIEESAADPYRVIGKTPSDVSYQWIAETVDHSRDLAQTAYARMKDDGWRAVPAKRHPKMPRDAAGRIVICGQVLMERPSELSESARQKEIAAARAMVREHNAQDTVAAYSGRYFDFTCGDYADPKPIETVSEPIDVAVSLQFRLSARLRNAARVCALSDQEYARRVVLLLACKQLPGLLFPSDDGKAFELIDIDLNRRD